MRKSLLILRLKLFQSIPSRTGILISRKIRRVAWIRTQKKKIFLLKKCKVSVINLKLKKQNRKVSRLGLWNNRNGMKSLTPFAALLRLRKQPVQSKSLRPSLLSTPCLILRRLKLRGLTIISQR